MFFVASIFQRLSGVLFYLALVSGLAWVAVQGTVVLGRQAALAMTMDENPHPVSRVDVGLEAQSRARLFQPVAYELQRPSAPAADVPLGVLARQMDAAEQTKRIGPRVAGWSRRQKTREVVAFDETPADLVLRSLKSDL